MNVKPSIKEKRRMLMPRTSGWTGRRREDISVPYYGPKINNLTVIWK